MMSAGILEVHIGRNAAALQPVGSSPSDDEIPNTFTGEVNWVEIDVGATAADADHQIDPDELLRAAMARQ
jgi:hypothetical protein